MKGASNIISSIHHLRIAVEHWDSFCREHPGSKGAMLFKGDKKRVEWIVKDLITHIALPQSVRDGIKAEWNSDVFAPAAITEKAALLNPQQRDMVETLIDGLLNGEEIKMEKI